MTGHKSKGIRRSAAVVKVKVKHGGSVFVRKLTVGEAAERLGRTREHLSRVLHGHRPSRSLTRRYASLVKEFLAEAQ
jgi:hypothetical protein